MIKERFIEKFGNKESSKQKYNSIFNALKPYEESFGKDIAEWTTEEYIEAFVGSFIITRLQYITNIKSKIKAYVKWYDENIKPVDIEQIASVDINVVYRKYNEDYTFFPSLRELLTEVDKCIYYDLSTSDAHYDNEDYFLRHKIIAIFLWCGYTREDISKLQWKDINNNFTELNGRKLTPQEKELVQAWFNKKEIKRYRGATTFRHPEYILKVTPSTARLTITNLLQELAKLEERRPIQDKYPFACNHIWLNGLFARMWKAEQEDPGFNKETTIIKNLGEDVKLDKIKRLLTLYKSYKEMLK